MLSPSGLSDCKSFVAQHHAVVRALSLGESGARYIDQCASPWRQSVRSGDNLRPWFRLRCGRVKICYGDENASSRGEISLSVPSLGTRFPPLRPGRSVDFCMSVPWINSNGQSREMKSDPSEEYKGCGRSLCGAVELSSRSNSSGRRRK